MAKSLYSRVQAWDTRFYLGILAIAVLSRVALTFANWYTLKVLPKVSNFNPHIPDSYLPEALWLDGWVKWDSIHYVIIASQGYGPAGEPNEGQGVGFFPAYPLLMRAAAWIMGDASSAQNAAIAGVVLSNIFFLLAALFLAAIVRTYHNDAITTTTIVLLSFSPVSFFFSAAYTESLFVMAVAGAFLLAERSRWLGSSMMIFLASATRLLGLVLIPAILYMAWRRGEKLRAYIPLLVVAPLGTASYFGWLWWEYRDVFAYFNAQANWGGWDVRVTNYISHAWHNPLDMISDPMRVIIVLYVAIALAFACAIPLAWKAGPKALAAFSAFMVLFHLVYTWNSLGRYMLPALGCFVGVAWALHQPRCPVWVRESLVPVSAIVMTALSVLFAHGYWII